PRSKRDNHDTKQALLKVTQESTKSRLAPFPLRPNVIHSNKGELTNKTRESRLVSQVPNVTCFLQDKASQSSQNLTLFHFQSRLVLGFSPSPNVKRDLPSRPQSFPNVTIASNCELAMMTFPSWPHHASASTC
ncbi:hypothetical protein PIB30_093536, partial [Stylosanthes scabra]|nr:hypothetical protein [Stylosanthes scabra]